MRIQWEEAFPVDYEAPTVTVKSRDDMSVQSLKDIHKDRGRVWALKGVSVCAYI